jgi:hypothetical protein
MLKFENELKQLGFIKIEMGDYILFTQQISSKKHLFVNYLANENNSKVYCGTFTGSWADAQYDAEMKTLDDSIKYIKKTLKIAQ